jgi:RHS repeat-associated protein
MLTAATAKPSHALSRVRRRGHAWPARAGCKSAPRKISSLSRSCTHARCLREQTEPRGNALFLGASVSGASNLRFPGQYADSETGQFYNYFRNYMASQGRYTQNDPIGLAGGLNRFGYVEGNPLSMTDPLGLLGQGSGGNGSEGSRPPSVSVTPPLPRDLSQVPQIPINPLGPVPTCLLRGGGLRCFDDPNRGRIRTSTCTAGVRG